MSKHQPPKRIILSLFLVISILFALNFACTNEKPDFRFIFMTDIHVQPELKADQGFKVAIQKVNSLKPDFVITGGDLIMDALGQSQERATQLYTLYKKVSQEFAMPVYNTIGNHELFGLYIESGISPDHPEYGKAMYKNHIGNGSTYTAFNHKNWHFILLDAVGFTPERRYIGQVDSLQLRWLAEDLKKVERSTPIVVSLHIPLISVWEQVRKGGTAPLGPGSVVTNSKEVLDLFKDHNLVLVLQGHLHIIEEIIFQNTHFVTGGAVSGGWWKGPHHDFPPGFVVVDVKDGKFSWHYETFEWVPQPE
jgi:3',5'-cyclic AMP phosphodiesterase CpdA